MTDLFRYPFRVCDINHANPTSKFLGLVIQMKAGPCMGFAKKVDQYANIIDIAREYLKGVFSSIF